ncbi:MULTISPECIES: hypothetical protein [pseudomallei group]|uniref:Uncharacterized protein n=1 Tax=Burkholderia savannae TaxID=1637837 RepID=A0ABR5TEK1_9BURK|nr:MULTISPECIES: hypothetical protein [pseudomallei group]KWZ43433.1 hypothetical protein WS72_11555 [Burkholderia savannae]KWZ46454.1 hypothetical protein WS73_20680 [Burkholderia savannae]
MRPNVRAAIVMTAALFVSHNAASDEAQRTASKAELAAIIAKIKSVAKDPDSVRVRNVVAHQGDNGLFRFCGELNAKNSYGGYTGFQPFSAFAAKNGARVAYVGVVGIDNPELAAAACERDGLTLPN